MSRRYSGPAPAKTSWRICNRGTGSWHPSGFQFMGFRPARNLSAGSPPARKAYSILDSLGSGQTTAPTGDPKSARTGVRSQLLYVNISGFIVLVANARKT